MKKALTIVSVLVALIIISLIVTKKDAGAPDASASVEQTAATVETNATPTTTPPPSNWTYSEDEDKMTNDKRYFASVNSTNTVDFEFPYDGGSSFTFTVRKMGSGNETVLKVSKGQFMPSYDETLRIKFDDEKPITVGYNSSADGSADVIFPEGSKKIISRLKTAKHMIIEAPFYNAGRKQIEFDVEGLTWDR